MTTPAPALMTAIEIPAWGGSEVLALVERPMPTPGPGEVRVRVEAVGINPADVKIRNGTYSAAYGDPFPMVLGRDFSGVVDAVSDDVAIWRVGDAVVGSLRFAPRQGTYASHIVVRDAALARRPANVDAVTAAALPVAGLTAWQALIENAVVAPGQRVLIHAAAGGVGHVAVQLARQLGAYVIGTASPRNHDFVRQLGAHEVIDYTAGPFEEALSAPVDVVVDAMGNEILDRSLRVLVPNGIAVTMPNRPDPALAESLGVRVGLVFVRPDAMQLEGLAAMVADGRLRIEVQQTFTFDQVREAHDLLWDGHVRGKLVLTP